MQRNYSTTGQKAALVALVFIGILTLGLGFYKVRSQIAGPFATQVSQADKSKLENLFTEPSEQEDIAAQKSRDTDNDGLSDYDELSIHRTSPYLKDTDSDGYDDKTEIDTGNDPNCAKGKACFTASASNAPDAGVHGNVEGSGSVSQRESVPDSVNALEQDLKKLESLTSAQVRELLKQQGFTDEDLKDIDDETIATMYRQSLQEAIKLEQQKKQEQAPQQEVLPGANANQGTQQQIVQELANLTKPQIIQMLKETGQLSGDQLTILQQLDETQVKTIFMQALQNAQTNYGAKRQ